MTGGRRTSERSPSSKDLRCWGRARNFDWTPRGGASRSAWFVKLNHAIADRMAAMAALGAFLDDEPDAPGAGALPWSARPPPPARELFADSLLARARSWSGKSRAILHPVAAARARSVA